jgi:hypothetical protein
VDGDNGEGKPKVHLRADDALAWPKLRVACPLYERSVEELQKHGYICEDVGIDTSICTKRGERNWYCVNLCCRPK